MFVCHRSKITFYRYLVFLAQKPKRRFFQVRKHFFSCCESQQKNIWNQRKFLQILAMNITKRWAIGIGLIMSSCYGKPVNYITTVLNFERTDIFAFNLNRNDIWSSTFWKYLYVQVIYFFNSKEPINMLNCKRCLCFSMDLDESAINSFNYRIRASQILFFPLWTRMKEWSLVLKKPDVKNVFFNDKLWAKYGNMQLRCHMICYFSKQREKFLTNSIT